ncbi:MAG: 30S ribosomal protein S17 [Phycisphaerales bacterium]
MATKVRAPAGDKAAAGTEKRFAGFVGVVESDKRAKTRTVVVQYQTRHAKYGKYMKRRTVIQAHDEANDSRSGDTVEIAPCRPISKTKTWKVIRVVTRGDGGLLHAS